MKIKKINLTQSGFKGAEVHFLEANDRGVLELTKKGFKNPIHFAMEKGFKDLRFHILSVYGIINDSMDVSVQAQLILESEVDSIELDGGSIVLLGSHNYFEGKSNSLKTFRIDESDGYEHWEDLKSLVEGIVEETTLYMQGSKKVEDSELIMRWAQAKKSTEITEDKVKGLSPEQLKDMALTIIEKGLGGMVHLPEEFDMDSEDFASAVEDVTNVLNSAEIDSIVPAEEGAELEVSMDEDIIEGGEEF